MTFDEVKKDYLEITHNVGYPYDMSGAFVDAEKMEKVIMTPSKLNAKKYMIEVLQYGFQWGAFWRIETGFSGADVSIDDNEIVKRIYEKYCV